MSIGYGIFYRRYDLNSYITIKQANDNDRQQYLISDPNILDLFPNVPSISTLQSSALSKSQRFLDPNFQTPIQHIVRLNATKQLPFGFTLSNTISYTKSLRQTLTRNINAPIAGTYNPLILNSGTRPLGGTGNIYETFSNGQGKNFRFSSTLTLPENIIEGNIIYSFTKGKNNTVTGSGLPNNPYDFSQEYGFASNDGVHNIYGDLSYTLPFKINLGMEFNITSGSRFNIITGKDTNGDGFFNERPAFADDLTKPNLVTTKYGILDPNPTSNSHIIPRNLGQGSMNYSFDASLGKSFGFMQDAKSKKPKYSLSINIYVNNLFNIVNKGNPVGNISSPYFLKTLSNSFTNYTFENDTFERTAGGSGRSFTFHTSFRF